MLEEAVVQVRARLSRRYWPVGFSATSASAFLQVIENKAVGTVSQFRCRSPRAFAFASRCHFKQLGDSPRPPLCSAQPPLSTMSRATVYSSHSSSFYSHCHSHYNSTMLIEDWNRDSLGEVSPLCYFPLACGVCDYGVTSGSWSS